MRAENPDVPVLVVSATALPEIRKSFINEGALDYVVKPFDASSFSHVRSRLIQVFPELGIGNGASSQSPHSARASQP
jgi:CheY-like chemotaxis protein